MKKNRECDSLSSGSWFPSFRHTPSEKTNIYLTYHASDNVSKKEKHMQMKHYSFLSRQRRGKKWEWRKVLYVSVINDSKMRE